MPTARRVAIDVGDVVLRDAAGDGVSLSDLDGVSVLVLMRHRH